jgi:hypothetical protein
MCSAAASPGCSVASNRECDSLAVRPETRFPATLRYPGGSSAIQKSATLDAFSRTPASNLHSPESAQPSPSSSRNHSQLNTRRVLRRMMHRIMRDHAFRLRNYSRPYSDSDRIAGSYCSIPQSGSDAPARTSYSYSAAAARPCTPSPAPSTRPAYRTHRDNAGLRRLVQVTGP